MRLDDAVAAPEGRELPVYDSENRPHPALEELVDLYRYRDLVYLWTQRNVKLRYKRSILGVVWTLLEPLTLLVILTIVFSRAFRFPLENYPLYLLPGLLMFDFFRRSTLQIVEEVVTSQNLAERIRLPRTAFAAASVTTYLVNWVIAHLPLLVIVVVLGAKLSPMLLLVPVAMLLTACFALGVGLLVATAGAYFPDLRLTYQVLLTALFYATPVLYPLQIVPENLRPIFTLNPLYHMAELARLPVWQAAAPAPETWAIAAVAGIGTLLAGWWAFTTRSNAFGYLL